MDIDGSWYQFVLAGLEAEVGPVSEHDAKDRVRDCILVQGFDTGGYPLSDLVADRIECGWMAYVPVPAGQVSIGRAIFYVADDGVLEHSSSSMAPSVYAEGFRQRYRQRRSGG